MVGLTVEFIQYHGDSVFAHSDYPLVGGVHHHVSYIDAARSIMSPFLGETTEE